MDESTDGALGTSMPGRWLKLTQQMYIVGKDALSSPSRNEITDLLRIKGYTMTDTYPRMIL